MEVHFIDIVQGKADHIGDTDVIANKFDIATYYFILRKSLKPC